MATITIQEMLGSDNVALSRSVINSNFNIVKDAVNTIENYLNTSPVGGELTIGKITISIGSNTVTDVNFISETSARIEGNLQVLKSITIEEACNLNNNLIVKNNTTIERNNSTINYLVVQTRTTFEDVINIDIDDTIITVDEAIAAPIDVKDYGTSTKQGKNVLNIDLLGAGTETTPVLQIGDGDVGQLLFVRFPVAPVGTDTYELDNSNFDPIYTSGVKFTGTGEVMKKTSVLLSYTSVGWFVLNVTGPSGLSTII